MKPPPNFEPPTKESLQRSYNAGRKKISNNNKILIDGRYLNHVEIAKELGLTRGQVTSRINREKKKPGPITLAALMQR